MRIRNLLIATISIALLVPNNLFAATPKSGSKCAKLGVTLIAAAKKFTCVKSGGTFRWNKGVSVAKRKEPIKSEENTVPTPTPMPMPTPTPTPTPMPNPMPNPTPSPTPTVLLLPTSFEDLYERRFGISTLAWEKASQIIKNNSSKIGNLEIITGPNTKPNYENFQQAISLVSRLFPGRSEPPKTLVIRYAYQDLDWAERVTREHLSPADYENLQQNEQNRLVSSNCSSTTADCRNAKQQTASQGLSIILQGTETQNNGSDPLAKLRVSSGMGEAHEYFHSLQRIPILGKSDVWPHAWFREGSAEWVQNVVVNHESFSSYKEFLRLDCEPACTSLTESEIKEFLTKSKENFVPANFDSWLNYPLGSLVIESLVALKGPDTLIEMYAQMGERNSFDQAFRNTFGVEWSYAIPILARTIYANLHSL